MRVRSPGSAVLAGNSALYSYVSQQRVPKQGENDRILGQRSTTLGLEPQAVVRRTSRLHATRH